MLLYVNMNVVLKCNQGSFCVSLPCFSCFCFHIWSLSSWKAVLSTQPLILSGTFSWKSWKLTKSPNMSQPKRMSPSTPPGCCFISHFVNFFFQFFLRPQFSYWIWRGYLFTSLWPGHWQAPYLQLRFLVLINLNPCWILRELWLWALHAHSRVMVQ